MDCTEAGGMIDAYLDGELSAADTQALEQHLAGCANCRILLDRARALRDGIRVEAQRFTAPAHLEARIRSSLGLGEPDKRVSSRSRFAMGWRPMALAASWLIAVLAGGALDHFYGAGDEEDRVSGEVVAADIRSLLADHLTDIASTDPQMVKPWFGGKLSFAPPVADLTAGGYPLVGGRLDYLHERQVAALVYSHGQHAINVFIWPEAGAKPPELRSQQGYAVGYFKQGGMEYWIVSDADPAIVKDFCNRLIEVTKTAS